MTRSDAIQPRPIFIIGSYRSGTSVLSWCIGQHPNIWVIPETNWIARLASSVPLFYGLGSNYERAHFRVTELPLSAMYQSFSWAVDDIVKKAARSRVRIDDRPASERKVFALRRSQDEPKNRWVDGTPENSHFAYPISQLFPEAKFIHIVRDPNEVVRSLMHFERAGGQRRAEIEGYKTWLRLANAAFDAEAALGSAHTTRMLYRDFVEQPEAALRRLFSFLGEEFCPESLFPLQERINSSQVDDIPLSSVNRLSRDAEGANEFYEQLVATKEEALEPDEEARSRLELRAADYASRLSS